MPNLGERLLLVFTAIAAATAAFVILVSYVMVGNRSATTTEAFFIQALACAGTLTIWGIFRTGLYLFAPGLGHTKTRKIAFLIGLLPITLNIILIVLGMAIYLNE